MATFLQEDKISEIKNTVDIIEIVSESVTLKKTGQNYMGLCPFHSEKTPSFSVNPQRAIFHCFGCGAGGDVISFLIKRDGLSFPEAVKVLAGRYGIELPEKRLDKKSLAAASERESLFKINKIAMDYFHQVLLSASSGKPAQVYLKNRGMGGEIARKFMLGYVSEGWDNLSKHLLSNGISRELTIKSGLVVSKDNGHCYDRFRNRVIFPIIDISGQVTGFGGRVMDTSLPKYLNSPETTVYNKSRLLYGYNCSRNACRESETVHVVEGYFDLIALYSYGVENTVATLGTAISRDHIRMLSRGGVKRFVLVFDSDEAGLKASERSIPIFQKEFINANILVLPKGYDPDSYIRDFGLEAFMTASSNAMGVIQFLTESAIKKHGLSVEGRINIIETLSMPLVSVEDSIARSLYIRDVAARIGVDEKAVHEKINGTVVRNKRSGTGNHRNEGGPVYQDQGPVKALRNNRWQGMEHQVISMMLQFPEIIEDCRKHNVVGCFDDEMLGDIGRLVLDYSGDDNNMVSYLMTHAQTGYQRELVAGLAIGDIPWLYEKCLKLIYQFVESKNRYNDSLSDRIKAAEENGDHELLIQLIQEKKKYSEELKEKQAQARKRY